jgi:hypothetical protein
MPRSTTDQTGAAPRKRKPRRRRACGQPMPNAHGEPSGHIMCTLQKGHEPPHVCATDYVRHTWEPPGAVTVKPKPAAKAPAKPKAAAPPKPPKRKPAPARRSRQRRPRRRRAARPTLAWEVIRPLFALGVAGAAVHVLNLTLPHLA